MTEPGDPPPVVELAPAGIATCDACGQDNAIPIVVTSTGHWQITTAFDCGFCGIRNDIDIPAFQTLLQMNLRQP